MKIIELVPALELGNKLNVDVIDFPGLPEEDLDLPAGAGVLPEAAEEAGSLGVITDARRKRCGITLEYAPRDVRQLKEQGLDRDGIAAYYAKRVYDLVRVNISQDWVCCGGMDEVMEIVLRHVDAQG